MKSTLVNVAEEMLVNLKVTYRDGKPIVVLNNNAPEWMVKVIRTVHDGALPDDYIFDVIYETLELIVDGYTEDDICADVEAPVYSSDLIRWFSEAAHAAEYVDEALELYNGQFDSIWDLIGCGYVLWRQAIMSRLFNVLREFDEEDFEEVE